MNWAILYPTAPLGDPQQCHQYRPFICAYQGVREYLNKTSLASAVLHEHRWAVECFLGDDVWRIPWEPRDLSAGGTSSPPCCRRRSSWVPPAEEEGGGFTNHISILPHEFFCLYLTLARKIGGGKLYLSCLLSIHSLAWPLGLQSSNDMRILRLHFPLLQCRKSATPFRY